MEFNFDEFMEFIKYGNLEGVQLYFVDCYLEMEDKYGLKPIHWACLSFNIEILEWILRKCDIETLSKNGWRPIHFASYVRNRKIVKILIENYCKLDCQTDKGETILNVANGDCEHEFIDEILNENINLKIGLSMGLKCDIYCNHKFCLRSVVQCNFHKDEQIGLGRFGIIHKVIDSQNDQQFAVKTVKKYYYELFNNPNYFLRNINQFLPHLYHSKIVKLFGMIESEIDFILFMELMTNESLNDEIRKSRPLIDDKICRYCKDILQAVSFLHHKKILHGFINPTNILIDNNGGCKLAISIFSCSLTDKVVQIENRDDNVWKSDYLYPFIDLEIINNGILSFPYDIWWVGFTAIEMLTDNNSRYQQNLIDKLDESIANISNEKMKSFIGSMIVKTPNERPTADDLLSDEFIGNRSIDENNVQFINDDNYDNRKSTIDIIQNAINNMKIGLSMGLKCYEYCTHEFCLSSVAATNFKKGKKIGKGSVSSVYKLITSGYYWTMKIITNVDDENIRKERKYFEDDINLYRDFITHENIVKYFGAVSNLKKIFIFMEFVDGESLYQKIKKNKFNPFPLTTIKHFTKQILKGLEFLHKQNIIHRDIKSANILINKINIVKISDFGLSRFLRTISKHQKKSFCGTFNYMAPEVIIEEPYDCSADIWSLGATVFEMATGHPPYYDMVEMAVIFMIANKRTIEYPPNLSDNIKSFLNKMINAEPGNRLSAESLLSCKFLL